MVLVVVVVTQLTSKDDLSISFSLKFSNISCLVFGNLRFTLLICEFLSIPPLLGDTALSYLLVGRIGTNRLVGFFVDFFKIISTDSQLDVTAELAFEAFFIILLQGAHVIGNMLTEDMGTVNISVEALSFSGVTGETLNGVRDVQTTIDSTLHGTEDTGTSGGTSQTNIQITTESTGTVIDGFNVVFFTGDFSATTIQRVQAQFVQDTAGNQQTGTVSGSVVGQTNLNTVFGQFMGVGSAYNAITFNAGEGNLYGDVLVGQTYNQTVFGCVVLVLVLEDQAFTGIVIGFTLTTPA